MLKARKKITKRQIKEDKFVTAYFKAVDYLKENANKVLTGVVAVCAVVLIVAFIQKSKRTAELNASEELAKATAEIALKNSQKAIDALLDMSENYSGTKSAERGVYLLAHTYYENKDYERALETFKKFMDDYGNDEILTSSAYTGMGACQEQLGKYIEAAKIYEGAAKKHNKHFHAPQQLMNAGRCYTLANEKDKAKKCYEKLLEEYPKNGFKVDAELFLSQL